MLTTSATKTTFLHASTKHNEQEGYAIYGMETTSRSECYTQVEFPQKVCLVLGNEVIGVDTAVLALCDRIVEIPTFGAKNSLNVARRVGKMDDWGLLGRLLES